jgi:hypothetical protein
VADASVHRHFTTFTISGVHPFSQRDFPTLFYFIMATSTASSMPSSTTDAAIATCTIAVPGKYGHVPPDACNAKYSYDPQYAPAVAVAVIFAILTMTHIALAIASRKV